MGTEDQVKTIFQSDAVAKTKKGVTWETFAQLKTRLGVIREEILARRRKLQKEESERRAKEQTPIMQRNVAETGSAIDIVETEVNSVEKKASPLHNYARMQRISQPELVEERCEEAEAAVDAAKDFFLAAKEQAMTLDEGIERIEPQVEQLLEVERKKLDIRLERIKFRLDRVQSMAETLKNKVVLAQKKQALMRELETGASRDT